MVDRTTNLPTGSPLIVEAAYHKNIDSLEGVILLVEGPIFPKSLRPIPARSVTLDVVWGREAVKLIVSPCQIHRGCTIEVRFGDATGGRIPWPDPDLKPDAQRDFPGSVPIQLRHFFKDGRANAREGITAATAELAELREETKKLARLVARFRDDELVQALRAPNGW